jgi:hypothetical protein
MCLNLSLDCPCEITPALTNYQQTCYERHVMFNFLNNKYVAFLQTFDVSATEHRGTWKKKNICKVSECDPFVVSISTFVHLKRFLKKFYRYWSNIFLPSDYHLVETYAAGGEACELWWPLELCWWERKLLAGSPKPERSKGRIQTNCSPLILQVGGWAWC